ncbi:MAG: type I 3-dehydroquinate dehydratase [Thermoanaerobaculia bacterium]
MAKTVISIYEKSQAEALETVGSAAGADMLEIRVDGFSSVGGPVDFAAFRSRARLPLIYTRRGAGFDPGEASRALEAGFEFVDIELDRSFEPASLAAFASRAILSFHDFESTPELASLLTRMKTFGAAAIKIAVTPRRFDDNLKILRALKDARGEGVTLFGMGSRGLYSRILAPYYGSALSFVSARDEAAAAPGQFTSERAREIWGRGELTEPEAIFAVAGNPAAHSLSPVIHNAKFRRAKVSAAYTIAEVERLDEVGSRLIEGDPLAPRGLSITAPFKIDALEMARRNEAAISARALRCGAVNTLVRLPDGRLLADNSDVEGIAAGLGTRRGGRAAIVGTGGTARAALVALRLADFDVSIYGRSLEEIEAEANAEGASLRPLERLERFDGEVLVDTTSAGALVPYPPSIARPGNLVIDAAYSPERSDRLEDLVREGVGVFGGTAVLEAQAASQSRLFMQALGRRNG